MLIYLATSRGKGDGAYRHDDSEKSNLKYRHLVPVIGII